MVHVLESLPAMWETQNDFLAPGFGHEPALFAVGIWSVNQQMGDLHPRVLLPFKETPNNFKICGVLTLDKNGSE